MVTPQRAWSFRSDGRAVFGPTAIRFLCLGALLAGAFQLHHRADSIEHQERVLREQQVILARTLGASDHTPKPSSTTLVPQVARVEGGLSESQQAPSSKIDQPARDLQVQPALYSLDAGGSAQSEQGGTKAH